MTDTRELYQAVILDHNKSPRNFRPMDAASSEAEGYNPMCGDHLKVWVKLEGDRIVDVSFHGSGCAISKASASLMTTSVMGKTREEARRLFEGFHRMLTSELGSGQEVPAKLAVFAGVREFPMRVKCATLSWHALKSALENPGS